MSTQEYVNRFTNYMNYDYKILSRYIDEVLKIAPSLSSLLPPKPPMKISDVVHDLGGLEDRVNELREYIASMYSFALTATSVLSMMDNSLTPTLHIPSYYSFYEDCCELKPLTQILMLKIPESNELRICLTSSSH